MKTLETERLYIRELELADAEACKVLLSNEFDYYYGPYEEEATDEQRLRWIVDLTKWDASGRLYGDHAIVLKETGKVIGLVGIDPWMWSARVKRLLPSLFPEVAAGEERSTIEFELGYAVLEEHRGQGYGTEAVRELVRFAFDEREVGEIYARTDKDNVRSLAMMQRIGMEVCFSEEWGGYGARLQR